MGKVSNKLFENKEQIIELINQKKTYKEIDVKDKLDIEDGYYKFTEKNARFIVEEFKKLS